MGTHVDCIIPKEKDYSVEEIKHKLESVFKKNKAEYLHLEKHGTFTKNVNGKWSINHIPSKKGEPAYTLGEGDSFNINIYKKVINISSVERFSSLYLPDSNISKELFKILKELCNEFRASEKLLIGAGGFGETDYIMDMAYYENADFDQICKKMTELNGLPANDLTELTEKSWYFKK